ncbi:MAG: tRNA (adenosine(37)-N6)-threonylcarbamoyltransferase complex ATPase subunit type 1 TsaE [Anaerolineae bacterium]|nr:tRNA (adenosine(37)-N6)-threonylcarbamoyltransferase complex ATPase subunit type 1 TsaE [Anaerolineae bacterium]
MPILDEHTLDFVSHSAAQTHRFGVRLGLLLQPGDIVCLEGELGAGKTCLAQGIGEGMGVVEPITSPTFTLIAEYYPPSPAPPLYHIDVYRLDRAVREVMALGLDDYLLGDGVCLIEWADRIAPALPEERLWIKLRHLDASKRGVVVSANGARFQELLRDFRQAAFGM